MTENYFPWGIAEGEAFLGRKAEIAHLRNNILKGYHTLLLSPRRYGKTSLAKYTINQLNLPWVDIDLFVAQNEFSVAHKIIKGVQKILGQIDPPERWLKALVSYFKTANKTWTVGIKGIKLELTPENHQDIPQNIIDALQALEFVLGKKKQKVIIFIDEFQEIAEVKNSKAIEGAIRNFAQQTKHVAFIFSGSCRSMLKQMFNNKQRPLYALCDMMNLNRLLPDDYRPYLNKIARLQWNHDLNQEAFNKIMELAECHPRYVYNLCMYLWEYCSILSSEPTASIVVDVWDKLVNDRLKDTRELLVSKSISQIKLLALIAQGYNKEITGQLIQSKLAMSGSAISQAIKILQHDDYVEIIDSGTFRVIDPLLKSTLIQYGEDYFL